MRRHGFGDLYIEEPLSVLEQRHANALTQFAKANGQHKAARPGTSWSQSCADDMCNWAKQIEILERMIELRMQQSAA